MSEIVLRAYGPLNDFLPPERKQAAFTIRFDGRRSVKDAIEGAGVPHPEVELIVRNGEPVSFEASLMDGDRVSVFPTFCTIDLSALERVRPSLPDPIRFAVDGHLGKLARLLRLLGFDSACRDGAGDQTLASLAARDQRIVLTRDRELLKRRTVMHGYFVRSTQPLQQVAEVLRRYGVRVVEPLSRCARCNGELRAVAKAAVESRVPPRTRQYYQDFWICDRCGQVYWRGSHWSRLRRLVDSALAQSADYVA
jgi:uncharacterized protein with PIN domain